MGKLVLIIDQDGDFFRSFQEEFKKVDEFVTVHLAENGYRALHLLKLMTIKIPDLIFVAMKMPVMPGHEIVQEIRKVPGLSTVSIITYGVLASADEVRKAINAGANYHYLKPTSPGKISQMINDALKKSNITA